MKNIFKYAYSALIGVAAFTAVSCSDSYEYDGRGNWNATPDYADIYFPETSQSMELDPADPTTATIQVMRRNTSSALSVPFEITRNTDNVFTVGQANFAAGESVANIEVSFPNAQVGTPYTLQLTLKDPSLVSAYSEDIIYTYKVTRVKWNDVGFYYDGDGNKVEGWCLYTDDFIDGIFSTSTPTYPVRVQERDDQKGVFRVINAYGEGYPYNEPGDWDDSKDYYMIINATDPSNVFFDPYEIELGLDWGYGMFLVRHEAAGKGGNDNVGKYENGAITFPAKSFLIGMANYNDGKYGWYANPNGKFKLVLNPDLDLYTAKVTDYDWEPVFEGVYASEKLGTDNEGVALYKGVQKEDVEAANPGCYKRFEDQYGTPYMIASPYAAGYDLVFGVKEDGSVTAPYASQNTGMTAVGDDVYAQIRGAASTFTEKEIILRILFTNKDGSIEYGLADESLAYITWTQVGTGTYTYTFWFVDLDEDGNIIPVEDPDLPLYQRDDKPTVFKIGSWGNGSEFVFTWDPETGKVTAPGSYTGDEHPEYGSIYVSDVPSYSSDLSYEDYPCAYDEESSTFGFTLVYFDVEGAWGVGQETFKVDWGTVAAARTVGVMKKNSTLKSMTFRNIQNHKWNHSKFVGKKVNRKAIVNAPTLIK